MCVKEKGRRIKYAIETEICTEEGTDKNGKKESQNKGMKEANEKVKQSLFRSGQALGVSGGRGY